MSNQNHLIYLYPAKLCISRTTGLVDDITLVYTYRLKYG